MLPKLPLDEMSVEEKLQTMEVLWDSLSHDPDVIESPQWHGEILAQREQAIERGEDEFEDWETAKKQLRDELL